MSRNYVASNINSFYKIKVISFYLHRRRKDSLHADDLKGPATFVHYAYAFNTHWSLRITADFVRSEPARRRWGCICKEVQIASKVGLVHRWILSDGMPCATARAEMTES